MIKFKNTESSEVLPKISGAEVTIETLEEWNSKDDKIEDTALFKVNGTLEEKGTEWTEEWLLEFTKEDAKTTILAINEFKKCVDEGSPADGKKHEFYIDINNWIRVGFFNEKKEHYGYIRFENQGRFMTSKFEHPLDLKEFWRAIRWVQQQESQ